MGQPCVNSLYWSMRVASINTCGVCATASNSDSLGPVDESGSAGDNRRACVAKRPACANLTPAVLLRPAGPANRPARGR